MDFPGFWSTAIEICTINTAINFDYPEPICEEIEAKEQSECYLYLGKNSSTILTISSIPDKFLNIT